MGYIDSVLFLFEGYAQIIASGIVTMALVSILFRVLWEFR